ncbi:MAG TPA: hypothetical protein VFH53_04400, partial [Phycisphaerae bacterium]|nr:hypothetical protein [Phycisphaerae bacterium]
MPGVLAVASSSLDLSRMDLKLAALSPLVVERKVADGVLTARFTNAKFLRDKVFQEDGEMAVGLDGVVFNWAELQREYGGEDYFHTVKAMVARQGDAFVKALRGEAAGFVHDKVRRRWVAFTNHTASKPMFYYHTPDLLVCSTDFGVVVQVLHALGRRYTLDPFGAYCLLTYAFMLEDTTLVSEIKKLKAGQVLAVESGKATVSDWVRFQGDPVLKESKADIIDRLDALFNRAVTMQYEKDREYGYDHLATLSGGLDSRMGLLTAYELGYRRQVAMTFSQTGYLDARIAGQIATDLGLEFSFYALDQGHYLISAFEDSVSANGGLILFLGSAHLLSALRRIDTT